MWAIEGPAHALADLRVRDGSSPVRLRFWARWHCPAVRSLPLTPTTRPPGPTWRRCNHLARHRSWRGHGPSRWSYSDVGSRTARFVLFAGAAQVLLARYVLYRIRAQASLAVRSSCHRRRGHNSCAHCTWSGRARTLRTGGGMRPFGQSKPISRAWLVSAGARHLDRQRGPAHYRRQSRHRHRPAHLDHLGPLRLLAMIELL